MVDTLKAYKEEEGEMSRIVKHFKKWRKYNIACLLGETDFEVSFAFIIYVVLIEFPILFASFMVEDSIDEYNKYKMRKKDFKKYKLGVK